MFTSTESALSWAFQNKTVDIVKSPGINRMCGKRNPGTNNDLLIGLSPLDRRMQADNIVKMVLDIEDPACKELIFAEFGYQREDKKINNLMLRVIVAMSAGQSSFMMRRRGVRDIVLNYFIRVTSESKCGYISDRQIREHLRCNRNDVNRYKRLAYDAMDNVRYKALAVLHEKFSERGLIENDEKMLCKQNS